MLVLATELNEDEDTSSIYSTQEIVLFYGVMLFLVIVMVLISP